MSLYEGAVKKPIMTSLCFLAVAIFGLFSLSKLPVDLYPDIETNTIMVMTSYAGASASDIENNVTRPLENTLNSVSNLKHITSRSSENISVITLEFEYGYDIDVLTNDVRDKLDMVSSQLPDEVETPIIFKFSTDMIPILLLSVQAEESQPALYKILDDNIVNPLARVPGVGTVSISGAPKREVNVYCDPNKLDAYNLSVETISSIISAENRNTPGGTFDVGSNTYSLRVEGEFKDPKEMENIVVGTHNGASVYLRDVATVVDSVEERAQKTYSNGVQGAMIVVQKQSGANSVAISQKVIDMLPQLQKSLPSDVKLGIIVNTSDNILNTIDSLEETIMYAMLFVILVVFVFLGRWRATVIICITIPMSLVASFIYLGIIDGGSLNIISLSCLSIAIGNVVDDAIVVVENVERIMHEEKLPPYEATKKAMEGLTGAIIATSLVLAAVFVPVSFLGGITGQLYRQFTVTIVVSVLLSTVVALTLSPVMCSLILKPESHKRKNIVFRYINYALNMGNRKYVRQISRVIGNPRRVLAAFGVVLIAILLINRLIPTSFLPVEDQGYFKVELELPEGATLERTRTVSERAVEYLMLNPAVEYVQSVVGSSPRVGSSQARSELTVIMKPWGARDGQTIDEVMAQVKKDLQEYPECKVYLSTPPVIPGLGSSGGFEMQLEARGDATFDNLVQATDTLMYYASQRKELSGLSSSLQADIPQLYFDVDRDKVKLAGVPLADVFSTMKAYTGSVYVNDFNMFNRIYRVYIQAEAPYREHKENINLFFVRGADNVMIPLTSLGTTSYTTGPGSIKRFNMFNSAVIRGGAADGYSSGQAMEIIEQIAREHLPENIGVEWSGLSYQEKQAGGQTAMVLALVFLFVFLFLAALYESWTVPIAVLLSLPIAALGAYLGVWLCGLENDVYFQIGLVMLVGLAAKNAILIVEFAKEQVDRGANVVKAALHASQLRFRPILMTSLAFILGMLPMVIASGPGSASRQAIGTGVFFGMILAVTIGILLVPFFFVLIYKAKAKAKSTNIKKVTKRFKR